MKKAFLALALAVAAAGCGDRSNAEPAVVTEPAELNTILPKMRAGYEAIETARLQVTQHYPMGSGQYLDTRADVTFRAPASFAAHVSGPGTVDLYSDGTTYVETGPHRLEREWSLTALDSMMPARDVLIFLFDWEQLLSDDGLFSGPEWRAYRREEAKAQTWIVIEKDDPAGPYRYYIHPETFIVWRLHRPMPDGSDMLDQYLTSFEEGVDAPLEIFAPPK